MDQNDIPPMLSETGIPPEPMSPPRARWRWWAFVIVLAMFPLYIGASSLSQGDQEGSLIPETTSGLLLMCLKGLSFFGVFFFVALVVARPTTSQLMLNWRGGGMPFVWGAIYSIGLKIIGAVPLLIWWLIEHGLNSFTPEVLKQQSERIASPSALSADPIYFTLTLTVVSFVLAALREEIWRAAMFAGIKELFPKGFSTKLGKTCAIFVVALIFGCGHFSQGPAAAFSIGFVGAALGVIMLRHRSVWEATIAHGIFDASVFALLWLLAKFPHLLHPS